MILSTDVPAWVCPHCGQHDLTVPRKGAVHRQCPKCHFIFPFVNEDATSLEFLPVDPDDETWTQKWGPIRADRYQVVRVLAAGAQGKILLANQRHLNQPCVIKLVSNTDRDWAGVANRRLRNEALAGVRVNHPNVARVFDCDRVDESWYFVMEYIVGENLRRILQQVHRLCWEQVADIGLQVVAGLSEIHKKGLIHRDIKPSNLMIDEACRIKIMDLGLAKLPEAEDDTSLTIAGQILGTPLYMPPEQFDGVELDARADLYAFGATLYHLLTGHPPFEGANIRTIADRHRHDPVTFSDVDREHSPRWLLELIETSLAKRPEHRYASAVEVEKALRAHDGSTPQQSSVSPMLVSQGVSVSHGVTVMPFRNLSRRDSDDWIGDAIAEYISSRLMQCSGVHVVDFNVVNRIIQQTTEDVSDEPSRDQIMQAGRLVGVQHVVLGNFQRQGDQVRMVAHGLVRDSETVTCLSSVMGLMDELFTLEDRLTDGVIENLNLRCKTSEDGAGQLRGTEQPKAHEHYVLARRAFGAGDYRGAIAEAEESRRHDPGYGEPLSLMGACHARLGEYEQAIACHHQQEELADASIDLVGKASALSNVGAVYYYQGEYAVAFEFLDRASVVSKELDVTPETSKLFANLGMVLMRLGRPMEAEGAFETAIEVCKKFDDLVSMVWPYNGMGSVLLKQDRVSEGREFHRRALRLAEEVGDRVMVGVSQMNIGRCACLLGDYAESDIWFNSALGTLEGTHFWNGLTLVYEHMAESQLMQDRPRDALKHIDKRIELAHRHGNRRMEAEAWEQKARAFETMHQAGDALEALKKSVVLSQQPPAYESLHRLMEGTHARKSRGGEG